MKKLKTILFKTGITSLVGAAIMVPVTLIALSTIKPAPVFTEVIFAGFLLAGILLILSAGVIRLYERKIKA